MSILQLQLTLRQAVWSIVVCAALTVLCFTPVAPLVVAVMIVLPGFVIDRTRGGTGIIGGVTSSTILGVVVGIAHPSVSGQGSLGDLIAACPALYFIFVVSSIWGGIASMTLYWVIKKWRERGQRTSAMQHPRMQFTIRQIMGLIAVCAVFFAALLTPFAFFVMAIGIVVPGFFVDRFRGGAGIVGGMISASVGLVILGIVVYAYFYFQPDPTVLDSLGPPPLTLLMLGFAGVVWGALAGTAFDVVFVVAESYTNENSSTGDSFPQIVWLPDETSE